LTWYLWHIKIWWQYLVPTYRVYTVPRYTTIPKFTCGHVVSVLLNMMISTEVRHHTYLDLSTCRACAVKHMMMLCQYFPWLWNDPYPLHARGLGLCHFFSALVCDLLPRRLFHGSPKAHCPKSILVTILKCNAWEDTWLIWCLPYPSGGTPLIPGRYVSS